MLTDHEFLPVEGHPDDDECTHRSDGTDTTYCGEPKTAHEPDDPNRRGFDPEYDDPTGAGWVISDDYFG